MGKIAVVTGATSGIGEAVAVMLAKDGYDLVITGRREGRLQEVAKKLVSSRSYRHGSKYLPGNITMFNEMNRLGPNLYLKFNT